MEEKMVEGLDFGLEEVPELGLERRCRSVEADRVLMALLVEVKAVESDWALMA